MGVIVPDVDSSSALLACESDEEVLQAQQEVPELGTQCYTPSPAVRGRKLKTVLESAPKTGAVPKRSCFDVEMEDCSTQPYVPMGTDAAKGSVNDGSTNLPVSGAWKGI